MQTEHSQTNLAVWTVLTVATAWIPIIAMYVWKWRRERKSQLRLDSTAQSQLAIKQIENGVAQRHEERDDLKVANARGDHWQELYYAEKLEKQKELARLELEIIKKDLSVAQLRERLQRYDEEDGKKS
jgi:hypothetical protein